MDLMNKMLLKLYIGPIVLMIASVVLLYVFGAMIPEQLVKTPEFSEMARSLHGVVIWNFLGMMGASMLWGGFNSYRFWRWRNGDDDESCFECGGMTKYKAKGRFGPYYKCLACSKNRSAAS